jgi:hypothetical protein
VVIIDGDAPLDSAQRARRRMSILAVIEAHRSKARFRL